MKQRKKRHWTIWKVSSIGLQDWADALRDKGRGIWCYSGNNFTVNQYHRTEFCKTIQDEDFVFLAQYKDYPCLIQMRQLSTPATIIIPFCETSLREHRSFHRVEVSTIELPPLQSHLNYEDPQFFIYATYAYNITDKAVVANDLDNKTWSFVTYKNALRSMIEHLDIDAPSLERLTSENEIFDFVRKYIPYEDKNGTPISCPDWGSVLEVPPLQKEMPRHLKEMLEMTAEAKPKKVHGPEPESPCLVAEHAKYENRKIYWKTQYKIALANKDYPFLSCA